MVDDADLTHLRRCVALARAALESGDEPFGSVLVDAEGRVRFEDSNHVAGGDATQHPEFAIARWAAEHTSGEHCPMCAAAHGWVGLGRIVYASSSAQLVSWLAGLGVPPAPVKALPVNEIAPGVPVEGPVAGLDEEVHELHRRRFGQDPAS
jgi:tRNA(Arg) A34 adenosine deaminase TadA